jgi:hypothetical protein
MKASHNRTVVSDHPECPTYLWKASSPIELYLPVVSEIRPVEIHVIPDGSIDNKPSFCLVLETQVGACVAAQIDFETLWPAIEAAIKSRGALS